MLLSVFIRIAVNSMASGLPSLATSTRLRSRAGRHLRKSSLPEQNIVRLKSFAFSISDRGSPDLSMASRYTGYSVHRKASAPTCTSASEPRQRSTSASPDRVSLRSGAKLMAEVAAVPIGNRASSSELYAERNSSGWRSGWTTRKSKVSTLQESTVTHILNAWRKSRFA